MKYLFFNFLSNDVSGLSGPNTFPFMIKFHLIIEATVTSFHTSQAPQPQSCIILTISALSTVPSPLKSWFNPSIHHSNEQSSSSIHLIILVGLAPK
jgi:hypothetical protein